MTVPYSMPSPRFPFPALARRAGVTAMGNGREIAMACLMSARLASALLPDLPLGAEVRGQRAAGARPWFASLALPAPVRQAVMRLADATTRDPSAAAEALRAVASAAHAQLDAASRAELASLIEALTAIDAASSG